MTEAEYRQLIRRIHDCLEMASFSIESGAPEIAAYALQAARKALNESLPPSPSEQAAREGQRDA
jgi:hypothetical protein